MFDETKIVQASDSVLLNKVCRISFVNQASQCLTSLDALNWLQPGLLFFCIIFLHYLFCRKNQAKYSLSSLGALSSSTDIKANITSQNCRVL